MKNYFIIIFNHLSFKTFPSHLTGGSALNIFPKSFKDKKYPVAHNNLTPIVLY